MCGIRSGPGPDIPGSALKGGLQHRLVICGIRSRAGSGIPGSTLKGGLEHRLVICGIRSGLDHSFCITPPFKAEFGNSLIITGFSPDIC